MTLWIANASSDGKNLVLPFKDATRRINLIRLRDACSCPRCVNPSSGQREFRSSDIPPKINIRDLRHLHGGDHNNKNNVSSSSSRSNPSEDDKVAVSWHHDVPGYDPDHESVFSRAELKELAQPPTRRGWNRGGRSRVSWNRDVMERNQHWISYHDYLHDHGAFWMAMRSLFRYGLLFLRGVPEDEKSVERITTRMGPLRNSFYGLTWDVRSKPDAENVAYTNQFLGFHMDLLYMTDPPGYQVLHCMRNSLAGGESLFSDAGRAVEAIRHKRNDLFFRLAELPARYGYHVNGQHYEMLRPVVQRPLPEQKPRYFTHVNYSPPFQKPIPPVADNSDDEHKTLQHWLAAMRMLSDEIEAPENMFELKLQPGQCVIFDNRRVVHARRGFDLAASSSSSQDSSGGGDPPDRWLRGAYTDTDPLMSQFAQLRAEDPIFWDRMRVSEGAWKGQMVAHATASEVNQWKHEDKKTNIIKNVVGSIFSAESPT